MKDSNNNNRCILNNKVSNNLILKIKECHHNINNNKCNNKVSINNNKCTHQIIKIKILKVIKINTLKVINNNLVIQCRWEACNK